ncbi:MAG: lytic transglycosylase domain-containing protein [Deltaproteobacteria bacterium]|nr:lytic transglycosylase domain-containing protein [Deltaproteobacteria bacterium]
MGPRHQKPLPSFLAAVPAAGVVLVMLLGPAAPARADIFQCQRADGEVHFTNLRPAGPAGRRCRRIIRGEQPGPARSGASRDRVRARDRSPDRYGRYDPYIHEAAALYRLPESFIRAVMRVESDFSPDVVSRAGAMGLMQLMPRTATSMGVQDPFDPRQNILGGTRYLRVLANKFNGDLVLTIAAYNAGQGAVTRYRGVPPYAETRRYVQRVLRYYYAFRGAS